LPRAMLRHPVSPQIAHGVSTCVFTTFIPNPL